MTDRLLQEHIQDALDWEPSIDAADIAVSAESGVVTLRGDVRSYAEKAAAERVALGVYGVKGVANDINVRLLGAQQRNDTEIAQAVLSALKWNTLVPDGKITVTVSHGWVTLKGKVDWEYQRGAAANTIRDLLGVRGVTNTISLEPRPSALDVKSQIEAALKRSAEVDARRINVAVADGNVTLSGHVHSCFERSQARHAAWAAPGVKLVDDRIEVVPDRCGRSRRTGAQCAIWSGSPHASGNVGPHVPDPANEPPALRDFPPLPVRDSHKSLVARVPGTGTAVASGKRPPCHLPGPRSTAMRRPHRSPIV